MPKSTTNNNSKFHQFKMDTAREVGVTIKEDYNGDLTSAQAGRVGGRMTQKLIEAGMRNI